MTAFDFDFFVIGGGSGGVRAARVAAGHRAKVALAEADRLGGTCVIRGCIPKKLLVYASRFKDEFEDAAGYGWTCGETAFSWPDLIAAKNRDIQRLEAIYRDNLLKSGVTIFDDWAEFTDRHTLRLARAQRTVTAKTVLVATGGKPYLGESIDGLEHVITSNEAFELAKFPKRIVIVGGGYIAVEFAGIFAGLGAETTVVYRGDKVLRGFDEDLRDGLMEAYTKRGVRFATGRRVARVTNEGRGRVATLDDGCTIAADEIMFAIGRRPDTTELALDKVGVERGWNGHIVVDAMSRSSVENIYAVGDATDRVNLTPAAIREGHAVADSLFGEKPWIAEHSIVPTAVFSTPEIGTVGLAEHEALEHAGLLDIYKARFRPMKFTLAGRHEYMLMKLVVERESGRVVGCHVLGPDAAEIVQMAAIALRMGATKADFDATMALHPTVAEELVTMREAWTPPEMPAKVHETVPAAE